MRGDRLERRESKVDRWGLRVDRKELVDWKESQWMRVDRWGCRVYGRELSDQSSMIDGVPV